jgi:hypothetical protein
MPEVSYRLGTLAAVDPARIPLHLWVVVGSREGLKLGNSVVFSCLGLVSSKLVTSLHELVYSSERRRRSRKA